MSLFPLRLSLISIFCFFPFLELFWRLLMFHFFFGLTQSLSPLLGAMLGYQCWRPSACRLDSTQRLRPSQDLRWYVPIRCDFAAKVQGTVTGVLGSCGVFSCNFHPILLPQAAVPYDGASTSSLSLNFSCQLGLTVPWGQAYLADTAGLVSDHYNKVNLTIKLVTGIFWTPRVYKSCVYTIL